MSVFDQVRGPGQRPPGSIEVRHNQVAEFYSIVVETWDKKSEIWALAYGGKILGVAGALSGMYGNMYFRRKLRLKNYGFFSTYLPNMALPFIVASNFHEAVCFKTFIDSILCLKQIFTYFNFCYRVHKEKFLPIHWVVHCVKVPEQLFFNFVLEWYNHWF